MQEQMWLVMDAFHKDKGLIHMQLDSFNYFLEHDIQEIIYKTEPIILIKKGDDERKYTITFTQLYLTKPSINENQIIEILPNEARQRLLTYESPMHIDIRVVIEQKQNDSDKLTLISDSVTQEYIAKIPIMLKSKYCNLLDKPNNESKEDPGGYFIINGAEKAIVTQDGPAENLIYAYRDRDGHPFRVEVKSPGTLHCYMSEGIIYLTIAKTPISICAVLKALGVKESELIDIILYSASQDEYTKFKDSLKASITESSIITDRESAYYYIGTKIYTGSASRLDNITFAKNTLSRDNFLQHMNIIDHDTDRRKAYYIGFMIIKLLRITFGLIEEDDRDHYLNRRLNTTGTLMSKLFKELFTEFRTNVMKICRHQIDKGYNQFNIQIASQTSSITKGLNSAISTGNWGLSKDPKNMLGVSQELGRLTSAAAIAHLRRVNMPLDRTNKQTGPRHLHASQFGYFCPAETPEGAACGLVKAMALTSCCSLKVNPTAIISSIWKYIDDPSRTSSGYDLIFVNGAYIGPTKSSSDVLTIIKKLRLLIEFSTISITHDNNTIMIFTDAGRVTRPLLKVNNGKLLLKSSDLSLKWSEFIEKGLIEMIDPREENTVLISMFLKDITPAHTHAEIHPALMLGTSASAIPYPDHNPSPRNSYAAGMVKQAIGVYSNDFQTRFDSLGHILWYPQKPMAGTKSMKYTGFNKSPGGMNVIVAIAIYSGYNQEDSVIMSRGAIDRGMFRSTYYSRYLTSEENDERSTETIDVPDKSITEGTHSGSYTKLDLDGIIAPGKKVSSNDILIGKISTEERTRIKRDKSISTKASNSGIVDKVLITTKLTGEKLIKVRVHNIRRPQVGDKFASRSSQKGTIGAIFSQEDMPFTEDGIIPDIIVNPHALPSRMTLGHLKECLVSKKGSLEGSTQDATPFNNLSIEEIGDELQAMGYERYGRERLMNGHTGKQMDSLIFIGPTYYQRLKHMVDDKVYSRARGPVVQLTRQPLSGKSAQGGMRLGEMERDGLISHGVANFMLDRLFVNSDEYKVHVCKNCGIIVDVNRRVCGSCGKRDIAAVLLPYACKLLFQELMSMMILPRLQLE